MIVRCSHCKKLLSAEKFDAHECDLPLNGVKRIEVVYIRDDSHKGNSLMTGWGTDGVLYSFEVVQRKAIPIVMTADEILQHKQTDEDLTESILALNKGGIDKITQPVATIVTTH